MNYPYGLLVFEMSQLDLVVVFDYFFTRPYTRSPHTQDFKIYSTIFKI